MMSKDLTCTTTGSSYVIMYRNFTRNFFAAAEDLLYESDPCGSLLLNWAELDVCAIPLQPTFCLSR